MRIWILIDGEPLPIDGKNIRLLRVGMLADELIKLGHEVVWWTSSFNHFKKEFISTHNQDLMVGPKYVIKLLHGLGYRKNISFRRIFHNRVIAKKFLLEAAKAERPDIILSALPTIELSLAATQYGKQHGVPVILDLRDMWPDIMVEVVPKILQPFARIALKWQFRAMEEACQNAIGLFGMTPEFLQWGLSYAKRSLGQFDAVYPLGYSDIKCDCKAEQEAELFWKDMGIVPEEKGLIISFVGSVNKTLQLDKIINAVKKLGSEVKLVIVGLGQELSKCQRSSRGHSNIILPGWLDKPKIHFLLRHTSIGVAPYIARKDFLLSIPNKIAEYLCAGLPIITSLQGVTGKLLEDNKCGFVYRSTNELIALIERFKQDKPLQGTMSKNARVLYEKKFVAENIYANMCDDLEKIANSYKA